MMGRFVGSLLHDSEGGHMKMIELCVECQCTSFRTIYVYTVGLRRAVDIIQGASLQGASLKMTFTSHRTATQNKR
jgi:hypothetical protein